MDRIINVVIYAIRRDKVEVPPFWAMRDVIIKQIKNGKT